MDMRLTTGAKSFVKGFRAFFYLCTFLLLPLYSVPEADLTPSETPKDSHAAGMDAPPPPLLESHARLASFNSPERRLFGTLPVSSQLETIKQTWHVILPFFVLQDVSRTDLAMFQQWRLEGG